VNGWLSTCVLFWLRYKKDLLEVVHPVLFELRDRVAANRRRNLFSQLVDIRWFEVVQQDTLLSFELAKLGRESCGRHVKADVGNILKAIRKGTLRDDRRHPVELVDRLPDEFGRAGVRRERHRRVSLKKQQAHRRYDVVDRNRDNAEIASGEIWNRELGAGLEFYESDRWVQVIRDSGEVRPGVVVEKVSSNISKHAFCGVDCDRFIVGAENILNEKRNGSGVIHVGVCEHDVTDLPLFLERKRPRNRTRVDGDRAVKQEGGHPTVWTVSSEAPQDAESHEPSITRCSVGKERTGRMAR